MPRLQRRRGDALVVLAVAEEDLADLEQRDVAEAAPRVALGRVGEAGNEARPHVGEIGGDRIGERQGGLAAAEQFGLRLGDERPGDRFAQAERRQRALGRAGALLQQRQHGARHARVEPRQRRRRHAVEAGDAHDLLDDVGLAVDVGAPVGHDRLAVLDVEAEAGENRLALALRDVEADEPLDFAVGEVDRAAAACAGSPATISRDGSPPQKSITRCVASSAPGTQKSGSTPRSKR